MCENAFCYNAKLSNSVEMIKSCYKLDKSNLKNQNRNKNKYNVSHKEFLHHVSTFQEERNIASELSWSTSKDYLNRPNQLISSASHDTACNFLANCSCIGGQLYRLQLLSCLKCPATEFLARTACLHISPHFYRLFAASAECWKRASNFPDKLGKWEGRVMTWAETFRTTVEILQPLL